MLRFALFALLPLLLFSNDVMANENLTSDKYNVTAVVKINNMSGADYDKLDAATVASSDMSIAYVCRESGVVVFKIYNANFAEQGDVKQYLERHILKSVPKKSVHFLDVHLEPAQGVSKC